MTREIRTKRALVQSIPFFFVFFVQRTVHRSDNERPSRLNDLRVRCFDQRRREAKNVKTFIHKALRRQRANTDEREIQSSLPFYSRRFCLILLLRAPHLQRCSEGFSTGVCSFQPGTSFNERYLARGSQRSLASLRLGRQNHFGRLRNRK